MHEGSGEKEDLYVGEARGEELVVEARGAGEAVARGARVVRVLADARVRGEAAGDGEDGEDEAAEGRVVRAAPGQHVLLQRRAVEDGHEGVEARKVDVEEVQDQVLVRQHVPVEPLVVADVVAPDRGRVLAPQQRDPLLRVQRVERTRARERRVFRLGLLCEADRRGRRSAGGRSWAIPAVRVALLPLRICPGSARLARRRWRRRRSRSSSRCGVAPGIELPVVEADAVEAALAEVRGRAARERLEQRDGRRGDRVAARVEDARRVRVRELGLGRRGARARLHPVRRAQRRRQVARRARPRRRAARCCTATDAAAAAALSTGARSSAKARCGGAVRGPGELVRAAHALRGAGPGEGGRESRPWK